MNKIYLLFLSVIITTSFSYAQTWSEIFKSVSPTSVTEQYYGSAVSVEGSYAVIGSYGYDSHTGCAYVLFFDGINWIMQAKLTASDASSFDDFGSSISISGDYIIIGAEREDYNGLNSGSAYVFEKPETGWEDMTETAKLTASDNVSDDYFGCSVSISGNTIVVGAKGDDDNGTSTGSAYIFEKPETGWENMTQTVKLTADDALGSDQFGCSVSISGETIVIGAFWNDSKGAAYVFVKPVIGWIDMTQTAKLRAFDIEAGDRFGEAVSISGDNIVVGSSLDDDNGSGSGSAYVYEKPETGWVYMGQTAKLTASDGAGNDNFGYSVNISGDNILIGSVLDDDNGNSSGSVYLFEKQETGWESTTETTKLIASDGEADEYFGSSVSSSGDNIIIGAKYGKNNGIDCGTAYLFEYCYFIDITDDVDNTMTCEGSEAVFSLTATASGITYQWQESTNGGYTWNDISGEISDSYTISNATLTMDNYQYRCVIIGNCNYTASATGILTVNSLPSVSAGTDQQVCDGNSTILSGTGALSYSWNNGVTDGVGFIPTVSQEYIVIGTDANTCQNSDTVLITIIPTYDETDAATICSGETFIFGTQTLTTAGTYIEVFQSILGCDSTVTLNLTVNPSYDETDAATICAGETYTFGTQTLTTSGTYVEVFPLATGCDSTVTLNLTVNPTYDETDAISICDNETYTFGTQTLTTAGTYVEMFQSVSGCDSTVTLNLTVNPTYNEADVATICDSETYTFGTQTLTTAGTYIEVFQSVLGCDSTVTLNLTVNSTYNEADAASICDGETYTFGTQTLTTTGTYIEIFQSVLGCDSTVTLNLTVNDLPNVSAGTDQQICNGSSTILSGTGAVSYTWNNGVTDGVEFTPTISQEYIVTGTDANTCQNSDTVYVGLIYSPTVTITGSTPFCQGDGTYLSSSEVTNNQWYIDGNLIEGETEQDIYPELSGFYTVENTQCNFTSEAFAVTVNIPVVPTITPSGELTFCAGGSVTLTSDQTENNTWNTLETTQSIDVTTSGDYYVTYIDDNGCTSNSNILTVTVNLNPEQPTITEAGGTLASSASSGNQWYFNGNQIIGETGQFYTPTESGYYQAEVTNEYGCASISDNFQVIISNINETDINNVIIYPNPTTGIFTVEGDYILSIEITNEIGQTVFSKQYIGNNNQNIIDISEQSNGIYFIKILYAEQSRSKTGNQIYTNKIILK